jgi:hypothetical protein
LERNRPLLGRKRKTRLIVGAVTALLAIVVAVLILLPHLFDMERLRQPLLSYLAEQTEGKVDFRKMDLVLFPRVHARFHEVSFSDEDISGTARRLIVYPELWSLARGRVRISSISLEAPVVRLTLAKAPQPGSLSIRDAVTRFLRGASARVPGLEIAVEGGAVSARLPDMNQEFHAEYVRGRLRFPPRRLEFHLSCTSGLWHSGYFSGWLDSENLNGEGQATLNQFRPEPIADYFLSRSPVRLGDSEATLDARFETKGLTTFQGNVTGSFPRLILLREKRPLVLRCENLKGSFRVDGAGFNLSLDQLDVTEPRFSLSGAAIKTPASPQITLDVALKGIDVAAARTAALSMAGDLPDVREVCEILQGGTIPAAAVSFRGTSPKEWLNPDHLLIRGSLAQGTVFVPDIDLRLDQVNGDAVISRGVLEARNARARMGGAQGRDGLLRLGLSGNRSIFHLETAVQADLSPLPDLLKRLVNDPDFEREMAGLSALKGQGRGRLVLGERKGDLRAKVDVSDFQLSARHRRIPYPVSIEGGEFSYEDNHVRAGNLRGRVGELAFSHLSGDLNWKGEPTLTASGGPLRIPLDRMYHWLVSIEGLKNGLKEVKSTAGTMILDSLQFKGPLAQPKAWLFQTSGTLEAAVVDSTLLPGPISFETGRFQATHEAFALSDSRIRMVDASLIISGDLRGYLDSPHALELTVQGDMGPDSPAMLS